MKYSLVEFVTYKLSNNEIKKETDVDARCFSVISTLFGMVCAHDSIYINNFVMELTTQKGRH